MNFLLYGANGYTGQLIIRYSKDYNLTPILAGRSEDKIKPLAESFNLNYKVFDLDDPEAVDSALSDVSVVLHAAGPFMYTAKPMIEACLRKGVHYLDITGEIAVFEMAHRYGKRAEENGIVIMPGVGFDVVPTDCMAMHLKNKMPDATHLKLAFAGEGGGWSQGTATTMVEGLGEGGAVRKEGKIEKVPVGFKNMTVDFWGKPFFMMTIPWGDVSTAFYTTGIPNIETYMSIPRSTFRSFKMQNYMGPLLRTSFVKNFIKKRIKKGPAGPTDEQRQNGRSLVYGEVSNSNGETVKARMKGPEGYTMTAKTSLMITKAVLEGKAGRGFQTPAKAFGADFILQVEGVEREDI